MAKQYFSLSRGQIDQGPAAVAQASSDPSADIAVYIDDTVGWTDLEVQQAMEQLFNAVIGKTNVIGGV